MFVIRPISKKDRGAFINFNCDSLLGMTNIPRNEKKLLEKIALSEESFAKNVKSAENESYTFVLENMATGEVGGTCSILTESTDTFRYYYEIETLPTKRSHPATPNEIKVLKITPNPSGCSEICALFLHPDYRHSGHGRLLSLSRFLFIAAFPHRFKKHIVAEMRGYIDQNQNSPFWEGVGRHFCHLSFIELMNQIENDHTFAPEILPQFPIYISLLTKKAQEAIGKTHDNTIAAKQMLMQENFAYFNKIDIFEGGPLMFAETQEVRTIVQSAVAQLVSVSSEVECGTQYILGNERMNFKACLGHIKFLSPERMIINEDIAHSLCVHKGDMIRYAPLH